MIETIKKERIKPEIIQMIKKDKGLKLRLCVFLNKHSDTLRRWLNENNEILTTKSNLEFIGNYFNTDVNELTETF
ncbi:MAG: hypothetical protein JXR68_14260 [Bacteroidales bacterium]|nr:hypothetical protein [Bacteroidales bacterium]